MPRWHCAQVSAMLARFTLERGSLAGQFVVRGVAVGAIGGDGQAGLQQPLAVDALAVMVHDVVLLAGVANGGLLPGLVAFGAERRDVSRKGRRGGIELAQGAVRAVAVLAERARRGCPARPACRACSRGIGFTTFCVADGAIHLVLDGAAGSHVGRRPAGMALHAGDAGMARAGQFRPR